MRKQWIILLALLLPPFVYAADAPAQAQIVKVLKDQFDRPVTPLEVPVVVVSGDFAVADWLQDKRGGRALLRRDADGWHTLMCSGAQFKSTQVLRQAGVQEEDASHISQKLAHEEKRLTAEQLKKIDSFEGVIDVLTSPDRHGHH
ncbi:MAG TPA: copper uptake system-associated protein [Methylophilus sp.]|nr:copper uptake system-associated protein [Methylophilus sp.]HQQ34111.1 copper uptake system-associated protein [Methylophilus sp.]